MGGGGGPNLQRGEGGGEGIKSGNWLGAIGSAAGGVAGFAKGALGAIAGKVAQVANFGQSLLDTVKHGLDEGVKITPGEFALPDFDWSTAEFSTLPSGTTTSSQGNQARQALDPYAPAYFGEGLVAGGRIVMPEQVKSKPTPGQLSQTAYDQVGESPNKTGRVGSSAELFQFVGAGYNKGTFGPISIVPAKLNDPLAKKPGERKRDVFLVGISGTEIVGDQATNWPTNIRASTQQDNDMLHHAREAIKNAIPPTPGKKPVLVLAGHSQGGMIAQQLAADEFIKDNYTVINTVTFGSPIVGYGKTEGAVNWIAAARDPVPMASPESLAFSRVPSLAKRNWHDIGSDFLNGVEAHNNDYSDEKGNNQLNRLDALGRPTGQGKGATLEFNPKDRVFYSAPKSYMVQTGRG